MSYNRITFACTLTNKKQEANQKPKSQTGSTVYRNLQATEDTDYLTSKLQNVIANLQRVDYGNLNCPQFPEEIGGSDYAMSLPSVAKLYLADFVRIEYRKFNATGIRSASVVVGKTVDKCAELCATKVDDCSAFEFCYDPESRSGEGKQQCTMIDSSLREKRADLRVELDKTGKVMHAGKLLVKNSHCHVFSLRKDSNEAQTRQLAFSVSSNAD